ncbi:YtxH domain-containing protein [Arthrobacter castelli]|uniref:YtxH domain-containing protein n=1 Tax=Arthrobacter castelli TaxID=271431 RepID=UPI00041B683D|nr:YtxH domain-containing protein [Arthrobacter castelli]
MKNKIVFGTGIAIGFLLGSRSGRQTYDKLMAKTDQLWHNPKVQDTVSSTTGTVKEKAPGISNRAEEAVKKVQHKTSGNGQHREEPQTIDATADVTGPSGGHPYEVEEQPFQNQAHETRPDTTG